MRANVAGRGRPLRSRSEQVSLRRPIATTAGGFVATARMHLALPSRLVRISELVLPELRSLPPGDRPAVLRRAATTPFDALELIAIAVGLVFVTWLTGYGVATMAPLARFANVIANGAVALLLMVVVVAPIQWRRTRRGVRDAAAAGRERPVRRGA